MSQGPIRLSLCHWIKPLQAIAYATLPDGETGSRRPTATQEEPAAGERVGLVTKLLCLLGWMLAVFETVTG